ncbi:hypothetical protein [Streptomyces coelicoflavus]|uniref:hypothetical protein n=1 Tax=Streptomyces coelicoflavus TaxID=285562 RepID=UPI0036ACADF2
MLTYNSRPIVSLRDAAKALGVTAGTMRNWRADGRLPELDAVTIASGVFFYADEVEALATQRKS